MDNKILKGASVIMVALLVATVFTGVNAAPVMPFTRYGDGTSGSTAPASTLITSWIDGVEYGQNTSTAAGYYTIETVGDELSTTTVKEGGVNADHIDYVLGGRLTTASAGTFASQMDNYTAGAIVRGALSSYATQPRQLKINNVSSQSTLNSAAATPNDYVVIWNPAGATVDITTYSLAVGTAAAQPIIAGDIWTYKMYAWATNPVPAGGFIAINMAKWGGLSATGNAIKLIHTGTAFIVDRVEYGTIATQPENTILTDAANPASAQQIRRTTAGTDTNSCSVDFGTVAQWLPQDLTAPVSQVTAITPYFWHTQPSIACTNSDTGGGTVTSVSLWYRYSSPTNGTFGAWTMFQNDTTAPFGPFDFTWPSGVGWYEFYTRAGDAAGNWEAAPANPGDDNAMYDNVAPTSNVNVITPYFYHTTPLSIPVTSADAAPSSGLTSVSLWYRWSSPTNGTMGAWTMFQNDTTAPFGPFDFTWPSGVGWYEFYTRAGDAAGNWEAAPANPGDDNAMYDNVAPTSNVNVITPYFYHTTPLSIAATSADAAPSSGLTSVSLWYRWSSPTNGTMGAWTMFQNDTTAPFGPFDFTWPSGVGWYEFYTRAGDAAGNWEAAPANPGDDNAMYDTTAPTSSINAVTTIWPDTAGNLQINVTNQADAAPASGVRGVEFWYRFEAGAWTLAFNDTASPYNYGFTFPSGNGYYAFYSRAYDQAGNYEAAPTPAPATNDTWTCRKTIGGASVSPSIIWANKTGSDVRLEWSDGSGTFEVYRSTAVDGTGFNFATPYATTTNKFYVDAGILGNGNSYSYVVRGQGSAISSNIAWKYARSIVKPANPNINWIALPYRFQPATLEALAIDIGDAITWDVRVWSASAQQYRIVTYNDGFLIWEGDTTYAIQPGDAVLIFCMNAGVWDIVGSHNPGLVLNVIKPVAPNINWLALPINHNYTNLEALAIHIGDAITWEIRVWSASAQQYRIVTYNDGFLIWEGDTTYAIQPGDAVLIFCMNAGTWNPNETNP